MSLAMCDLNNQGFDYLLTQTQLKPTNNQGKLQPPRPFKQQWTTSFAKVLTYLVVYAGHGQNVMQGRVFLRLSPTSRTVPELKEKWRMNLQKLSFQKNKHFLDISLQCLILSARTFSIFYKRPYLPAIFSTLANSHRLTQSQLLTFCSPLSFYSVYLPLTIFHLKSPVIKPVKNDSNRKRNFCNGNIN